MKPKSYKSFLKQEEMRIKTLQKECEHKKLLAGRLYRKCRCGVYLPTPDKEYIEWRGLEGQAPEYPTIKIPSEEGDIIE